MSILQRDFPHPVSSLYTCEAPGCGKEVSDVDVVSYILSLALPGKNGIIPAFACQAEQHFGCCEAHAWQALIACHDEHLQPRHQAEHARVEADESLMQQVQKLQESQPQRPAWRLKP